MPRSTAVRVLTGGEPGTPQARQSTCYGKTNECSQISPSCSFTKKLDTCTSAPSSLCSGSGRIIHGLFVLDFPFSLRSRTSINIVLAFALQLISLNSIFMLWSRRYIGIHSIWRGSLAKVYSSSSSASANRTPLNSCNISSAHPRMLE